MMGETETWAMLHDNSVDVHAVVSITQPDMTQRLIPSSFNASLPPVPK